MSKRLIKFSWIHLKEHCMSIKMMFHACTLNIGRLGQDNCHESVANPGHMSKFCPSLHYTVNTVRHLKGTKMLRSNTEMHGEGPTRMKSGSELSHSSLGICIQLYTYVGKGMDGYTEMLKISPRYYNLLFYILQLAQSMFCTFPTMDTYQLYRKKKIPF